jgi:oxygen-independent coproporphyrinogen-3 oxidase
VRLRGSARHAATLFIYSYGIMFSFSVTPPLSLYIHIPWCVRKCPYCDFNSHAVRDAIPESAYLDALSADLEQELPGVWGRTVQSIFLGGGTPSLFSAEGISQLLEAVRARVTLTPGAEITLEANPGTVDRKRFSGFRDAGVNRLSLGIQSFNARLLERIGRIHDAEQARGAIAAARAAGFDNLNLDLMFGLPGQTREQALADLHTAVELRPEHLSWYELTIEPNTWFSRYPPARPDADLRWDMQQQGGAVLRAAGYKRYEVSAWSRPGQQCRHNLNYWQFGDYLGLGAGAHGKLSDAAGQTITRSVKIRHPRSYLENATGGGRCARHHALSTEDAILEFVMNALRLDAGFSTATFGAHTGLPAELIERAAANAAAAGLLVMQNDRIRCTPLGRRYLNDAIGYFMEDTFENARSG